MKIFLECPNCHDTKVLAFENAVLTVTTLKNVFKNNPTYCVKCAGHGVGKISMNVIRFDWDKSAESVRRVNDKHAPIYIDPVSISPEKIEENKKNILNTV
jgi:hypothetical protein